MKPDPIDKFLQEVDQRMLAIAAISLLVLGLLAGLLYGIKPAWIEYSNLRVEHEHAKRSSHGGTSHVATSIASLREDVVRLHDELYGGAAGIPRRQIESFIVDSLDLLSTRHDVRLIGITPDQPTTVWMFEELPYQVEVEGSFFAIHRWLYDVEDRLRPMVVKQFQISPSVQDDLVVLDLRVVAYRTSKESGA